MFKRAGPLAAVLLAALVLAPGATPGTYADKSGDSGSAGDITGIQVAADKASGQMIFRVEGSNLSTSPNDLTILFIDSDANPATGQVSLVGADYVFAIDDTTYEFDHWNGSDWVETPNSTVRVTGGGPALMISVNRSELGNTSNLNLWARSVNMVDKKSDDAPDDGTYNYSIDANGPDIQSLDLKTAPIAGPKHGKKFVVTPAGLKLPVGGPIDEQPPDSYSCTAKLGQRPLRGTGTGACTYTLPRKSRGKQLRLTVTVNYEGASKSFTYSFRVR
jgi:hypothetical protein